ncbi:xylulokinase [Bacillus sp. N1-1]|uniref:xylulokinase n=1 Tax=Bacillus sp. N1-1 TaxID=2682541 RepID=UPI001315DEF1|nr:xylulokinase [Bacillus sp. N1-1]QHA93667.1 xylulokinase [Bacillus sp. N1-1]
MKYVIGIDLGSSAVKAILVDRGGIVHYSSSKDYPLINEKSSYSEQDVELWYSKTKEIIIDLLQNFNGRVEDIEGISFSGQMHGLVLLDEENQVLRNAILWNDTRTTHQCREIEEVIGKDRLLSITKNQALEGFTLPKILWVKENESDLYEKSHRFLLPKDYLRYRLTGHIGMDYTDAAGTLLLDIEKKEWSHEMCDALEINPALCPPLMESFDFAGQISEDFSMETGLSISTKVFAGGADNACGAIGAGILSEGKTLCSLGTSGVILTYESTGSHDYKGKVHYFNHGKKDAYYSMGVTLSAGYSLSWFRDVFASNESFSSLLDGLDEIPPGSNGLLFSPYLVGERTPHADASIRASFIGVDGSHTRKHFVRALIEGVTFSLKEALEILKQNNDHIDTVISIGGGAKNKEWLQMQADIFETKIITLSHEQGPALGAAILAAYGCGWYSSLEECSRVFISYEESYMPVSQNVEMYRELYPLYQEVYEYTKGLSEGLERFRSV